MWLSRRSIKPARNTVKQGSLSISDRFGDYPHRPSRRFKMRVRANTVLSTIPKPKKWIIHNDKDACRIVVLLLSVLARRPRLQPQPHGQHEDCLNRNVVPQHTTSRLKSDRLLDYPQQWRYRCDCPNLRTNNRTGVPNIRSSKLLSLVEKHLFQKLMQHIHTHNGAAYRDILTVSFNCVRTEMGPPLPWRKTARVDKGRQSYIRRWCCKNRHS